MSIDLNHTIVAARDQEASAKFLADILGLAAPRRLFGFTELQTSNGVRLDFQSTDEAIPPQHYAFLVSEEEFDAIWARIRARGLTWWADPGRNRPGELYALNGGRGLYFADPAGHYMEIMTRPYA